LWSGACYSPVAAWSSGGEGGHAALFRAGRSQVCYTLAMRYHKAVPISRPEADFLISTPSPSLNECVVVEDDGQWYDVRRMTEHELAAFVDTLHRARLANVAAGAKAPH